MRLKRKSRSTTADKRHFETDHLVPNLRQRTISGVQRTLIAQALKFVIQISTIVTLGRLLSPEDFGLFTMVATITMVLLPFSEGGLSAATIQAERITHEQVSGLFWINLVLGTALSVIFALSSPVLGWLYDDARVIPIACAMAAIFVLSSFALQSIALLRRQMRFAWLTTVDVFSLLLGFILGVALALKGFGPWALVAMQLSTVGFSSIVLFAACGWVPGRWSQSKGFGQLFKFGIRTTIANLMVRLHDTLGALWVGWAGGATMLGYYSRAFTIVSIPQTQLLMPVLSVGQAALARLSTEPDRLAAATISVLRRIALVTTFIMSIAITCADWIVLLFLGDQWTSAGQYVMLIGLALLLHPATAIIQMSLIASGQPSVLLKVRFIQLTLGALSLAIGQTWGTLAAVTVYASVAVIIRDPTFIYIGLRSLGISNRSFITAYGVPLLLALSSGVAILIFRKLFQEIDPVLGLMACTAIGGMTVLSLGVVDPHVRREISSAILKLRARFL